VQLIGCRAATRARAACIREHARNVDAEQGDEECGSGQHGIHSQYSCPLQKGTSNKIPFQAAPPQAGKTQASCKPLRRGSLGAYAFGVPALADARILSVMPRMPYDELTVAPPCPQSAPGTLAPASPNKSIEEHRRSEPELKAQVYEVSK
jgi:hypothetical protein